MKRKNPGLHPYIERIEKICAGLKKQELAALIINMAGEEAPARRQGFLDKLMEHLPAGSSAGSHPDLQEGESLLEEFQWLKESIQARIASIDDGTYWDDPDDDWDEDYYSDEDPDYLSEDQQAELASFFNDAGEYFLQNRLPDAKALYEALFSFIGEIDYGFLSDIEVDIKEAHARYCRTVYELAQANGRVREMAMAMNIVQPQNDFDSLREGNMAMLQDIIDAQVGELPDMAGFLPQWRKFLAKEGHTPDRLARLRVEVALMTSGLAGVQELAEIWKEKQPIGYLAWLAQLAESGKWQDLGEVAQEALAALPLGKDRREVAGYLVRAGRQLGNNDLVLQGRREAFRSSADGTALLHLLAEADKQQVRTEEITGAITFMQKRNLSDYQVKPLLAKLFLMAGDLQSLVDMCKGEKVYGWSGGSPGALLFCAVLYCGSDRHDQCALIKGLLAEYAADDVFHFGAVVRDDEKPATTFMKQINKGLAKLDIPRADFTKHIEPTLQNGRKRVEHIVSNKHRKAYGRAAYTLGAMAEMLVAQGKKQQAKELLHKYYFELYNRHSAFRGEVRGAVASSPLLAGMGI